MKSVHIHLFDSVTVTIFTTRVFAFAFFRLIARRDRFSNRLFRC